MNASATFAACVMLIAFAILAVVAIDNGHPYVALVPAAFGGVAALAIVAALIDDA